MLGYDVYQVAHEGKMVCVVPADQAEAALAAMRANKYGADAAIIGEVVETPEERDPRVSIRTGFGACICFCDSPIPLCKSLLLCTNGGNHAMAIFAEELQDALSFRTIQPMHLSILSAAFPRTCGTLTKPRSLIIR